jgi:hypothetical protein
MNQLVGRQRRLVGFDSHLAAQLCDDDLGCLAPRDVHNALGVGQ